MRLLGGLDNMAGGTVVGETGLRMLKPCLLSGEGEVDLRARSLEMAARIFRASIGQLAVPVADILKSDEFKAFCAVRGRAVKPLSPLFDVTYYIKKIPFQTGLDMNPVLHFCRFGPIHGQAPSLLFDATFVRRQLGLSSPRQAVVRDEDAVPTASLADAEASLVPYSDIVELFVALLENIEPPYLSPHPLFDPTIWHEFNEGVPNENPAASFVRTRDFRGRPFSPFFSISYFARTRPYLRGGEINPLLCYLTECAAGKAADVNPMFHAGYYHHARGISVGDALSHFLTIGRHMGLPPNPFADQELGIDEAARVYESLGELYLDYLRCDAELAGARASRTSD
ncbi:hypothetical protein [Xanthobacter aminoxidans]|uniref:hypothetical protein n=2 Tax=Xanthobacter aminoxidans TaxID=186280 RepID=UPI0020230E2E|nr:hypothetical protein [Xanthobacter aminoxidans]